MNKTSYHRLGKLLQTKVEEHAQGITFLEAQTESGHTFELWATIEDNEIDTRFFVVAPGMRVFHVYLSDFQRLLHDRDKVVTNPVEGAIFGQGSYVFRMIVAHAGSLFQESLKNKPGSDDLVYQPNEALIEAFTALGRDYRHVLLMDGKLVTGELIKTR